MTTPKKPKTMNLKERRIYLEKLLAFFSKKFPTPPEMAHEDPLEGLIIHILRLNATPKEMEEALQRIQASVVNLNELRSAFPVEVKNLLAPLPEHERKSVLLLKTLRAVFEHQHAVNLDNIIIYNKREGKPPNVEFLRRAAPWAPIYVRMVYFEEQIFPVDPYAEHVLKRVLNLFAADEKPAVIDDVIKKIIRKKDMVPLYHILYQIALSPEVLNAPECKKFILAPLPVSEPPKREKRRGPVRPVLVIPTPPERKPDNPKPGAFRSSHSSSSRFHSSKSQPAKKPTPAKPKTPAKPATQAVKKVPPAKVIKIPPASIKPSKAVVKKVPEKNEKKPTPKAPVAKKPMQRK